MMFLNALNISERQVRTAMKKLSSDGTAQGEGRGGRREKFKNRDENLKIKVIDHINRFPRMESHYCRKSSTQQYLYPDLTITKTYQLYSDEESSENRVSFSFYRNIFKTQKSKFPVAKKDQCGVCEPFRKGNKDEQEELKCRYEKHVTEKDLVREIKKKK